MTTPSEALEVYCVKCKAKTVSRDIEAVTMKNGRSLPAPPAQSTAPGSSASASSPDRLAHPSIVALHLGLTT